MKNFQIIISFSLGLIFLMVNADEHSMPQNYYQTLNKHDEPEAYYDRRIPDIPSTRSSLPLTTRITTKKVQRLSSTLATSTLRQSIKPSLYNEKFFYGNPVAFYWKPDAYPNPINDPFSCRQTKPSLLCDPDQLLDPIDSDRIRELLADFKQKQQDKCFCLKCPPGEAGIKIGVAIAGHINGDGSSSEMAGQNFADHIRKKWRYGLCNDSVLILLVGSSPNPPYSILSSSSGEIAKRVFSGDFFSKTFQNATETLSKKTPGQPISYAQLIESILSSINDHVSRIEDPSRYQHDDPMVGMANDQSSSSSSNSSMTAVIVVMVITGFIIFIAIIIGGAILLKRHYQNDPDPELPDPPTPPPVGYHAANTSDPDNPDNEKVHAAPIATVSDDDGDRAEEEEEETLGEESIIPTPRDSPEQQRKSSKEQ